MAGKDAIRRLRMVEDGNLAADITSKPINISRMKGAMIQITTAGGGSPTGDFEVQASLDYEPNMDGSEKTGTGTWVPLTLSSSPALAGADADLIIDIIETQAPWIRLFYDRTSGTGTMQAYLSAKQS